MEYWRKKRRVFFFRVFKTRDLLIMRTDISTIFSTHLSTEFSTEMRGRRRRRRAASFTFRAEIDSLLFSLVFLKRRRRGLPIKCALCCRIDGNKISSLIAILNKSAAGIRAILWRFFRSFHRSFRAFDAKNGGQRSAFIIVFVD